MNLSQNEYNKIRDLIYTNTGISLRENKRDFLTRRISSRIEELNLKTDKDYYRYLILDRTGEELEELVNLVVIPETYFFRDYPQLKLFAEQVLPLITRENLPRKNLNILSAGCSTGDEPHTLAIILKEMLDNPGEWDIRIDAVDINKKHLQKAQEGIYSRRAIRETPHLYRDKYFTRQGDSYVLTTDIKEMVTLRRINLFDKEQVSKLFSYDVVFCRNVLIYFDHASAEKVMEYFYDIMNPGAFIFLGSAESVGRLTNLFKMIRIGKSFIYQK